MIDIGDMMETLKEKIDYEDAENALESAKFLGYKDILLSRAYKDFGLVSSMVSLIW